MEPHAHGPEPQGHPSLWPVGFAVGIAILLTGLVVSWLVVAIGGGLALVFGFLWLRDLSGGAVPQTAVPAETVEPAPPLAADEEVERFPRSRFLEASTLGLGAAIGGLVTLPAVGFAILPPFIRQGHRDVDVGPLDAFPENEWRVITFMEDPDEGEVTRRTAFARYNGLLDGRPSFTIISNHCVHLGCPVQPSGPMDDKKAEQEKANGQVVVTRIPVSPAAFACPCHGGAYDKEGNRTSGPPVRALDRYAYAVKNGRLILLGTYSVGKVKGEGKDALIVKYDQANPGVHVDGPEAYLYPWNSPG